MVNEIITLINVTIPFIFLGILIGVFIMYYVMVMAFFYFDDRKQLLLNNYDSTFQTKYNKFRAELIQWNKTKKRYNI